MQPNSGAVKILVRIKRPLLIVLIALYVLIGSRQLIDRFVVEFPPHMLRPSPTASVDRVLALSGLKMTQAAIEQWLGTLPSDAAIWIVGTVATPEAHILVRMVGYLGWPHPVGLVTCGQSLSEPGPIGRPIILLVHDEVPLPEAWNRASALPGWQEVILAQPAEISELC